ncbi:MAG: glycosyltransferase family 2 protein [Candidatus Aminicenantes bacterium]|nr:glycosyltransferase family 2 protein [Candidatus Aminicenantes bacterium]
MKKSPAPRLSLVIPVFNEEKNLEPLYKELRRVCDGLSSGCEILFIDDGSRDGSFAALAALQKKDRRVKVLRLRKNFGQTAALSAGFDYARGDVIVTLDADLQNDPRDIPRLLDKMAEGYDIVNGWRRKRKDKFLTRRLPSNVANWLIARITGIKLHDFGCTLKAFRSEVAKSIKLYGELHRFIPAIASNIGVHIAEIEVHHRPRIHGQSKYGIFRFVKVILDMVLLRFLMSYSTRPLQIFGLVGLISGLAGAVLLAVMTYQRLFQQVGLGNRPLLLGAILLVVLGVQLITLGLLAEIQVRSYHEASGKPIYFIREVLDADKPRPRSRS